MFRITDNIKTDFTANSFTREMLVYIGNNLVPVLEAMQKRQLFVDSIGADGRELGSYTYDKKNPVFRKAGTPFDMVFTSTLRNSIKVVVTATSIQFKAASQYENTIRFSEVFGTSNWFGLSPENMKKLVDEYLRKEAIRITRNKILSGIWN